MRKGIPNLAALQVFEASARHESFTRAADELALTQSAVCRQIASLENRLGVALFLRIKKRVVLTPHGRHYAMQIRKSLERIERDTLELMAQRGVGRVLELAVVPTFASQWLIPRLPQFRALRPDITVNLSIRTEPFLFSDSPFDAAVYFGRSVWPGTQGALLFREGNAVPVCSPALASEAAPLTRERLVDMPLLHLSTRPDAWREWFRAQGFGDDARAVRGPRYELFTMLSSAALAGMGVALMPHILIADELASGRLTAPLDLPLASDAGYYLVAPDAVANDEPFVALSQWLVSLTPKAD
ncbi:LysR substrate-binding domain-containing protein [Trinickia soli]|uniref:LysR family transcriptional regulator n=1 Tax=Trinickia soli TaxID=380675 RepID=A0A2N7WGC5_9BURK|nr:LysR substrate-binding domain-containing protein [Trinickia soli]KAA0074965.1 LysR family transcriptional regulator [Paraburkholderia sp. T12-10]PMS28411.1 LysR family transcriptional regulator [Trinickia soli]CAB3669376.1 Glycine cleavage system transcriptional activator [Trinickia soli]